jgi:hypothetical protein
MVPNTVDEVTEAWGKQLGEEHHNLFCSPNVVWMLHLERIRWGDEKSILNFGRIT